MSEDKVAESAFDWNQSRCSQCGAVAPWHREWCERYFPPAQTPEESELEMNEKELRNEDNQR